MRSLNGVRVHRAAQSSSAFAKSEKTGARCAARLCWLLRLRNCASQTHDSNRLKLHCSTNHNRPRAQTVNPEARSQAEGGPSRAQMLVTSNAMEK